MGIEGKAGERNWEKGREETPWFGYKTKIKKNREVILLQLVTFLHTHIYNLTLQFCQLYIFMKSRRKEVDKY